MHAAGSTLFVTFRLAGSIPQSIIKAWKNEKLWLDSEVERLASLSKVNGDDFDVLRERRITEFQRRWFRKFEDTLHQGANGPHWLKKPEIAQMLFDSLLERHEKVYRLHAFSIMSNHAHVVFTPALNERTISRVAGSSPLRFVSSKPTLGAIMQSLKGYTAHEANRLMRRSGSFWAVESYDRQIRKEGEFGRVVNYVLNNPVKAGLVENWRDWKWNWTSL